MKTYRHRFLAIAALAWIQAGPVLATSSDVQVSVEGNATCSSLSVNSVLQAKDTSVPGANRSDSVTGPDGQVFTYTVGPTANTISQWRTSPRSAAADHDEHHSPPPSVTAKPVNFVILKGAGSAGGRVFYFGHGAFEDSDETATGTIAAVSFCYGLPVPPPTPIPKPASLPTCDPSLCLDSPDTPIQARIITQFDEPTDPALNWQVKTCACEGATFTECNPDLRSGTIVPAGTAGACTNANLQFLPIEVQLGRDPDSYYCRVISGTRRCYRK